MCSQALVRAERILRRRSGSVIVLLEKRLNVHGADDEELQGSSPLQIGSAHHGNNGEDHVDARQKKTGDERHSQDGQPSHFLVPHHDGVAVAP